MACGDHLERDALTLPHPVVASQQARLSTTWAKAIGLLTDEPAKINDHFLLFSPLSNENARRGDFGKMLDAVKRRPDRSDCTCCSIGIFDVEKFASPFDIRDSLGRE
jgi:hypothetical protein